VNPDFIPVAGGHPSGIGFFAVGDVHGEIVGGLLYVALPMIAAGALIWSAIYVWSWRTGRCLRFSPNSVSAMVGVLSYSLLAFLLFEWIGTAHNIIATIPYSVVMALFLTWPVVIVVGPACLIHLMSSRPIPDHIIYTFCLVGAVIQYLYLEYIGTLPG
jgi:hypothetical protein